MKSLFFVFNFIMLSLSLLCIQSSLAQQNIQEIIDEAMKPYSETNHPLPLASTWQDGGLIYQHKHNRGKGSFFDLPEQISLIQIGHHFLPVVGVESYNYNVNSSTNNYWDFPESYYDCMGFFRDKKLPFTVSMTQWEEAFYLDKGAFKDDKLTIETKQNPFCGGNELNKATKYVSAFGDSDSWNSLGEKWVAETKFKLMDKGNNKGIYPNPPLVVMLSNNEAKKMKYCMINNSYESLCDEIEISNDDGKRKCLNKKYKDRYLSLQQGFRDGFLSLNDRSQWANNMKFVGYDVNALRSFGRWDGWKKYSTYYQGGKIMEHHKYWDGSSMSYYLVDGNIQMSDFKVYSPQIEFMNIEMILEDTRLDKSNFWYEMSVWDGFDCRYNGDKCLELEYDSKYDNEYKKGEMHYSKRSWYRKNNQEFTAGRYKGLIQFGMWLNRPRVVREFRMGYQSRETVGLDYFDNLLDAVDIVYEDQILKKFWRQGELIKNRKHIHPYQKSIPDGNLYKNRDRWYLLDTDKDPERPWSLNTEIPVFSLARVLGDKPNREWLVYAFAPQGEENNVRIKIPEDSLDGNTSIVAQEIVVDVSQEGSFYYVKENCILSNNEDKYIENDVLANQNRTFLGKTIVSTRKVESKGKATFVARDVRLKTNFWAKKGSDFSTKVESCVNEVGNNISQKIVDPQAIPFCNTTTNIVNLGSDTFLSKSSFNIYPNPVAESLSIEFPIESKGYYGIFIYDTSGRLIKEQNVDFKDVASSVNVDLSSFKTGFYLLKVSKGNSHLHTEKIIKK